MSNARFFAKSRLGTVYFEIQGEHLLIEGVGSENWKCRPLLLRSINPKPELRSIRVPALFWVPLFFSAACWLVAWCVLPSDWQELQRQSVPVFFMLMGPSILGAGFLGLALQGLPPLQFYVFRNHWGRDAFQIAREGTHLTECDIFVQELQRCIAIASGEAPPRESDEVLAPAPAAPPQKWLLGLVCGGTAAVLPWLPNFVGFGFGFVVVFFLTIGALIFSVYSFSAKEKLRWLSLLGAVLGLVPPLFY